MLSLSSEQGMGQYRWNSSPTVPYISNCVTFGPRQKNETDPSYDINPTYFTRGNVDSIEYRDIQIDFNTSKDSPNNDNETGYIKSKKEYYLHLEVPQHIQYTTTLKIKVCTVNTDTTGVIGGLNPKAYQEIRELVIPPAPPRADDNVIETIIVYEDPKYFQNNDESILNGDKIIAFKWASPTKKYIHTGIVYNAKSNDILFKAGEIYTNGSDYFKCPSDGTDPTITPLEEDNPYKLINYNLGLIQKDWLIAGSTPSIATFDIVFSPKFELKSNYQYILLEIDRSDEIQQQIQYVPETDNDKKTYYGTYMDLDYVKGELWDINNLLGSSIRTTASQNILNHIAVWGHPELLLCINGEEIKVGQTDFYEIEDYSIDFLGVVAKDSADRFTIDYQYPLTITNSDTTDEQGG